MHANRLPGARVVLLEPDINPITRRFGLPKGHPTPSIIASVIILAALATTPWVAGLTWTVPMFLVWLVLAGSFYALWSRRK